MRKRVMLFAAPLCIVAIAASVAVAAPSGAEHSRGLKLDKLHAERPIAASGRSAELSITQAGLLQSAKDIQDYLAYTDSLKREVENYLASLAAAEAAEANQTAAAQTSFVSSSSYPGDFLSCVRQRESGGNYSVYNAGGSGAAGAYQFLPSTWNSIAASTGRTDLIGVDPAQASPADQDAMAQALYAEQGSAPWGGAC